MSPVTLERESDRHVDFGYLREFIPPSRSSDPELIDRQETHTAEALRLNESQGAGVSATPIRSDRAADVGSCDRQAAKHRIAKVAVGNLILSALIALVTAILAFCLEYVSASSAGMFVLGSWLAHLIAVYNVG